MKFEYDSDVFPYWHYTDLGYYPDTPNYVLCYYQSKSGYDRYAILRYEDGKWWSTNGYEKNVEVMAWQKLPSRPQVLGGKED